jgi:hypothetical protein
MKTIYIKFSSIPMELAREGRIRVTGEAISLIQWLIILSFKAIITRRLNVIHFNGGFRKTILFANAYEN